MQAVIPHTAISAQVVILPELRGRCEARTCCGVRWIRLHERVSVQPLPNRPTECTVTRGRSSGPPYDWMEQLIAG